MEHLQTFDELTTPNDNDNMDKRKLTSRAGYAPHHQALVYDESTGSDVAVTYRDQDGRTASELVKRWNMHGELVEALQDCLGLLGQDYPHGNICVVNARDILAKLNQQ